MTLNQKIIYETLVNLLVLNNSSLYYIGLRYVMPKFINTLGGLIKAPGYQSQNPFKNYLQIPLKTHLLENETFPYLGGLLLTWGSVKRPSVIQFFKFRSLRLVEPGG